jgi:group I intron endonuclease
LKKEVFSVYVITNLSNGMKYVGMSKNIQQRWNNHKNANYFTSKLHIAIHAEGIDNFEMTHLADCFTRNDAELLEKTFISEYGSRYPNGYNQTDGGYGTAGRKLTDKQMDRMRHRNPMQQEHIKQRASERLKGVPNPRVGPLNNFYGITGLKNQSTKYKVLATNLDTNEQQVLVGIKEIENAGFTYRTVIHRATKRSLRTVHNNHIFELVAH